MNFTENPASHEISRRNFLLSTAAASAITLTVPSGSRAGAQMLASFSSLQPLGERVHPITPEEFHDRLLRAQEMMGQLNPKFDALFVGPGTSLYYFTGSLASERKTSCRDCAALGPADCGFSGV
jgi:hypothetical protein